MTHLNYKEGNSKTGKTKIISVFNEHSMFLGYICWNGSWRQYIWEQDNEVIMSWDCLLEVVAKIQLEMQLRKNVADENNSETGDKK